MTQDVVKEILSFADMSGGAEPSGEENVPLDGASFPPSVGDTPRSGAPLSPIHLTDENRVYSHSNMCAPVPL